ncbi:hypothetical protein GCM10010967_26880 [Dyadobacter beijingensis]|uniref:Outer membrane protein beta-barrel domain-containing protein n=1 Tax=Dyadobacter beijingensis TaxID=365489 RepID=A0ABQ2HUW7_9BACT|nr:hypothetical protein [Dyadobacter beijingensis]GGM92334.1 hypothetical protein GCM10010967_26880 [Dyadobacter beijingensis]
MKKTILSFAIFIVLGTLTSVFAQENETIFQNRGIWRSGGYAGISNKFTKIDGRFANMPEIYGGWFINQRLLIGIEGAATTNFIRVPELEQNFRARKMTYMYGQFGLMTEYVIASTRKVHLTANLMTGSGFTLQYDRRDFDDWEWDEWDDDHDENARCFFVMEPGVQVEFNLLKWMRFSPGISYRKAFNAKGNGLSDSDISNISYNVTLKFGRF